MKVGMRALLAALVGVAVYVGAMLYDKSRGAEWVVSPQQIEAAKAEGKAGVESRPGSIAVLPIRSETADALPLKWALWGIGAAAMMFYSLRKRKVT
ncbi:MAG TPA: hypothetical protein VGC51_11345 [Hansschlegelia sp.]